VARHIATTGLATAECEPPTDGLVASGLLDRADLLETLQRSVSTRVTVVAAPPGSGKTSLLRAWADRSAGNRRVAFVSVPRDEQSAERFWSGVVDAIRGPARSAQPETPPAPAALLDSNQLVDTVVSELAEHPESVVLIIDDLHELKSTEAVTQLEHLLEVMPISARVVFSSRRDPPIRLHRVRLAGEARRDPAGDLRFTGREKRELLAASGISLSDMGAAALHERAEGWAAGLRLAVISLSGHPEPERFVAEFSGTDRAIGEYLMAEMLERQPSEVQAMLLRTSLVERLNGELADLLTGRSGSEQMLLELEDATAFVVSLDAPRNWFRYHQLLADFLRLELRRSSADEVPGLHRRAARWFTDYGDIVEAVRHTLAAGDRTDAARLVADHSFRWVLDGQAGTIDAVLQAFPEGASADHPDLALAHAAAELNRGRLVNAAAHLTLAECHVENAAPARRRHLTVAIASPRLALARRSGQFTEVIDQVKLLDASITDDANNAIAIDSELRAVALPNLGIVETMVWAACRRRAPSLRGSRARRDDRQTVRGGRVSRASRFPITARLGCDRTRARPAGRGPCSASRLGGSADRRAGAGSARGHGGMDRRVRRSGPLVATSPGTSPKTTVTPPPRFFCTRRRAYCTPVAASCGQRSKHSRRPHGRKPDCPVCTRSRRGSPVGLRRRRLGSG
jgi:LuxR family transcriptional regulator, maltose regulon positive regulatory protein